MKNTKRRSRKRIITKLMMTMVCKYMWHILTLTKKMEISFANKKLNQRLIYLQMYYLLLIAASGGGTSKKLMTKNPKINSIQKTKLLCRRSFLSRSNLNLLDPISAIEITVAIKFGWRKFSETKSHKSSSLRDLIKKRRPDQSIWPLCSRKYKSISMWDSIAFLLGRFWTSKPVGWDKKMSSIQTCYRLLLKTKFLYLISMTIWAKNQKKSIMYEESINLSARTILSTLGSRIRLWFLKIRTRNQSVQFYTQTKMSQLISWK